MSIRRLDDNKSVVRAHPAAAGAPQKKGGQAVQALGRSRGGFSTKIHVAVDALGNPFIIPAKKNRTVQRDTDWYTYKERNLVERFINKIKQYRRIFTRFEKYASRYLAFLSLACSLIWLT